MSNQGSARCYDVYDILGELQSDEDGTHELSGKWKQHNRIRSERLCEYEL